MSLPLLWAVVLVVLIWWAPGWLFGVAVGVPRVVLAAAAPVVGLGLLSVVGSFGGLLHLPWTGATAAAGVVVSSAAAYLIRRIVSSRRAAGRLGHGPHTPRASGEASPAGRPWLTLCAGLLPGAAVAAYVWLQGTSDLQTINQDWDIPWHANMVRLIAESHQWDPHIAGHFAYYDTVLANAPVRSYPIALHALLALVWPASGLTIPSLLNVFVLVLVTVQLPLSTMALASVVTRRPVAVASAGALSTWLTVYPWDLLWRGPLIPYFAGMLAVGPFVLLTVVASKRRQWSMLPAAGLSAVGVIAIHPSLAFVAAPVLGCWLLAELLRRRGAALPSAAFLVATGAVAAVLGLPIIRELVQEAGRVATVSWAPDSSPVGAVRNLVFLTHTRAPLVYAAPVLMALAVVGLVRRPTTAWYLVPVAVYAALAGYTMASTGRPNLFTEPFYDDQWRIVAVYVMLALPLLGLGIDVAATALVRAVTRLWSRRRPRGTLGRGSVWSAGTPSTVAAGVGVVLAVMAVSLPEVGQSTARLSWTNKISGGTLSAGSVALMSSVSRWVPASQTVLADPCQGSVWMYALGDRMPMIRHFEILPTQRQELLLDHFQDLATDPAVRSAAAELNIGWVFVSGGKIRAADEPRRGLTHLADLPFLTLVAKRGDAALYHLDWNRVPGGRSVVTAAASARSTEPGVPGLWQSPVPSPLSSTARTC